MHDAVDSANAGLACRTPCRINEFIINDIIIIINDIIIEIIITIITEIEDVMHPRQG